MSATVFNTSLYKDFPFRKLLDNEAVYTIAANNIAGQYIQNRLSYWDKEDKHEWLHLGNRLSANNNLCFIYQDNVFSVLLEINNEHRINNPSKNRFIEHCKKNNLIPCLFPVTPKLLLGTTKRIPGLYVDDRGIPEFTFEVGCYPAILQEWKENPKSMEYIDDYVVTDKSLKLTKLHKDYEDISNWNLVNALTYEPIYPHKLAPNKQTKPSFYEFECRSFNFAEGAILNGKLFKSMEMGYPQVIVKLPEEKEIIEKMQKNEEKFKNTFWAQLGKVGIRRHNPKSPIFTRGAGKLPFFISGGGSNISVYKAAINEMSKQMVHFNPNFKGIEIVDVNDTEVVSTCRTNIDKLYTAVAVGLSSFDVSDESEDKQYISPDKIEKVEIYTPVQNIKEAPTKDVC